MSKQEAIIVVLGLLVINVLARLLPHAANFAPVTATGLFCGAYLGRRVSLPVTLLVLLISDYALLYANPYGQLHLGAVYAPWHLWYGQTQLFVYAAFGVSALAGQWLKTHRSPSDIIVVALFCSLQFFFITNAAVWVAGAYDRGLHGLYQAWVAGIPFFKGTLSGDLVYTAAFFGLYELAKARREGAAVLVQQPYQAS